MSLVSGSDRPLLLRMRPDLVVREQCYLGRDCWVIKDSLAQKYYRFEEQEYSLLTMLDGESSISDIQQRFQDRFAPQRISIREIHQLVAMLHRSSLVVSDAPGQGQELMKRRDGRKQKERVSRLTNVLAIRFKGIDPDRMLTWLDHRIGWLFSVPCLVMTLLLAASALLLVCVQFDAFQAKLPGFRTFFASGNWFWLALTLAVTKVIHEFGHGLACKRLGGECHEMGFMLLVLTPCLYCNVSDSWLLPSKWQRAAIGAAGMYIEILLASICTFLWWFSEPGLFNFLCLNAMFVCSVSTLLFNANPLMRYDGYYILSDLLEIPNLRQKSSAILRRKMGAWLLGLPEPADPFLPRKRQLCFASYSIAAALYRWVVVFGILWFLYHVFEPYGLQVIGQAIACVAVFGMLFQPLFQLFRFITAPGRMERVKKPHLIGTLLVTGLLLAAVSAVPLPHYVWCDVYLQTNDASTVYVESPGIVEQIHVRPGDFVRAGVPLVTLQNTELRLAIARLLGEQDKLRARLHSLRLRAFEDESAGVEIGEVEESLLAVADQLTKRRQDVLKLTVKSPRAGSVIPVAGRPQQKSDKTLPSWHGTPLDGQNLSAFMSEGVAVCQVGDPQQLEAVLAVDQNTVEFVRKGQHVDMIFDQLPGKKFRSKLVDLSHVGLEFAPASLSAKSGGQLVSQTDQNGREVPVETTYQASAPIEASSSSLFVGATGTARIRAGNQTLSQRAWRFICQTFNFSA